jgi:signal transduction histidine kinase
MGSQIGLADPERINPSTEKTIEFMRLQNPERLARGVFYSEAVVNEDGRQSGPERCGAIPWKGHPMEDTPLLPASKTGRPTVETVLPATLATTSTLPRMGNGPTLREQGGDALALSAIAHDARNLVTAMGLCAELIGGPGVLTPQHNHLADELRSIAESSARLIRRLTELSSRTGRAQMTAPDSETPVLDLSQSVQKLRNLLTAIAGPVIEVEFACLPCPGALGISEESLSRILLNLVRNATDAMPTGGRIRITTQRGNGESFLWAVSDKAEGEPATDYLWDDLPHPAPAGTGTVQLTVEDSGPGIPTEFIQRVFDSGFTTRDGSKSWPEIQHRGLGLSIVRDLVETAGGTVRAVSSPLHGARFEIELPLTNVMSNLLLEQRKRALSDGNGATMDESNIP